LVSKLTSTHEEDSQFSPQMVLLMFRWCYTYVFWIFVLCLWSDQSEFTALFMVFNLWIGSGIIFEFCS